MSDRFTYLPTALVHDFDWVHLHWSSQWLYVTIQQSLPPLVPGAWRWEPRTLSVQGQCANLEMIESAAEGLAAAGFLMVDEAAGECHLRSYLAHDRLIHMPNALVSTCRNITRVGSWSIRAAMVCQLRALRDAHPDLSGWERPAVKDLLARSYDEPEFAWIDEKRRGVMPFKMTADGVPESGEIGA